MRSTSSCFAISKCRDFSCAICAEAAEFVPRAAGTQRGLLDCCAAHFFVASFIRRTLRVRLRRRGVPQRRLWTQRRLATASQQSHMLNELAAGDRLACRAPKPRQLIPIPGCLMMPRQLRVASLGGQP